MCTLLVKYPSKLNFSENNTIHNEVHFLDVKVKINYYKNQIFRVDKSMFTGDMIHKLFQMQVKLASELQFALVNHAYICLMNVY